MRGAKVASRAEAMKLRLHQFLSKTGHFTSKREVKEAIWSGEVTVNGSVVKDIAFQFNATKKDVAFRGETLRLPSVERTFLLNKPRGVVCSRLNSQEAALGKRSVFEVFRPHVTPNEFERLVSVGRLDEDTTGLLLVTTNGDLVHRIASPEKQVTKRYRVTTAAPLNSADGARFAEGIGIELEVNGDIERYLTLPAELVVESPNIALVSVTEGKKRQVRRMFAALGHEVIALERLAIGGLNLAAFNVKEGAFVDLSDRDVEAFVHQDEADKRP